MRLFLALEIPERTRGEIAAACDACGDLLRGWRLVDRDALHVTLRFLGEVGPEREARSRAGWAHAAAAVAGFRFRLAGVGSFPPRGGGRVLWLGVEEPAGLLAALGRALEEAAIASGFEPERRPFHPHLTLARARRGAAPRRPAAADFRGSWAGTARRVVLYESLLDAAGARYTALAAFPLRAGPEGETGWE